MAHKGRKPVPRAVVGGLSTVPIMPASLPDVMRNDWLALSTDLVTRRMLTAATLGSLETYVRALWITRQAQETIEEHGMLIKTEKGALKSNPALASLTDSQMAIARLAAELGITPASRSRAGMGGEEPETDDEDDALGL